MHSRRHSTPGVGWSTNCPAGHAAQAVSLKLSRQARAVRNPGGQAEQCLQTDRPVSFCHSPRGQGRAAPFGQRCCVGHTRRVPSAQASYSPVDVFLPHGSQSLTLTVPAVRAKRPGAHARHCKLRGVDEK